MRTLPLTHLTPAAPLGRFKVLDRAFSMSALKLYLLLASLSLTLAIPVGAGGDDRSMDPNAELSPVDEIEQAKMLKEAAKQEPKEADLSELSAGDLAKAKMLKEAAGLKARGLFHEASLVAKGMSPSVHELKWNDYQYSCCSFCAKRAWSSSSRQCSGPWYYRKCKYNFGACIRRSSQCCWCPVLIGCKKTRCDKSRPMHVNSCR